VAVLTLNEDQSKAIRLAAMSAFAFWVCSQIADSTIVQGVWHQLTILAVAAGAVRICALEGAKRTRES
jgi:hypothetical protein